MDYRLEVFQNSFHSFKIFGVQKCKKKSKTYFQVHFYQIEVQVFMNWSIWLKNTKHLKFDIQQIFYSS